MAMARVANLLGAMADCSQLCLNEFYQLLISWWEGYLGCFLSERVTWWGIAWCMLPSTSPPHHTPTQAMKWLFVLLSFSRRTSVWYKNWLGLRCSDPLKSSPGCLLVGDSVGITSSCLLLVLPLSVTSHQHCLGFSVSISNS